MGKIKVSIITASLILAIFSSCIQGKSKIEKSEAIQKIGLDVMDLHDEVMPLMSKMNKLEKQLRRKARTYPDSALIFISSANKLKDADSLMWSWMHGYVRPEELMDSLNEEQILEYLAKEKVKVKAVNAAMKEGIDNAQYLLGAE